MIYTLEKKYHATTIEELMELTADLRQRISKIDHSEEDLQQQEKRVEQLKAVCQKEAEQLSGMRASASKVVEQELLEKLIPLGIAKARINIQLQEKPLRDRKSTRLNSSHANISYAVFCL